MIITNILVYAECLKGINENSVADEVLDRFKYYCTIIIKNNLDASFTELCDSCSIILKLMIENPDAELPLMLVKQ